MGVAVGRAAAAGAGGSSATLHDGAQQRLVALRINLSLPPSGASSGQGGGDEDAAMLRKLGRDVEEALDEVRSLARGIYPAPLADRGLGRGVARRRYGVRFAPWS